MNDRWRRVAGWAAFVLFGAVVVSSTIAHADGHIPNHFRVNAGGDEVEGSPIWTRDTSTSPSPYVNAGAVRTATTSDVVDITDPSVPAGTPETIFHSHRWDPRQGEDMQWSFPVDPGTWQVDLYFAETIKRAQGAGIRLFDVSIEGQRVLRHFDIYALVGGYKGVVTSFTIPTDTSLDITFARVKRRPIVSGIELTRVPDTTGAKQNPPTTDPSPSPAPDPSSPEPSPVSDPPATSGCGGVQVPAGADIQAAIDQNPKGTTFCLTGTYKIARAIVPKDGMAFLGPATLLGVGADTGFQIKTGSGGVTGAVGVTIDGLDMSGFSLRAIDCWQGTVVRNSSLHGNGRNGIGCGLEGLGGVVIENNDVYRNGNPNELGGGASGMKFAAANGVVIRDNRIHENIGNGVWCDVGCGSFDVVNNRVWGNTRKGIFYEISHGPALIQGNVVLDNNCSPSYWGDGNPECALPSGAFGPQSSGSPGGGIATNSSSNVVIRGNTLGGNQVAGINFRDDSRLLDAPFAIVVDDNVLSGDRLLHCGDWGVNCTANG